MSAGTVQVMGYVALTFITFGAVATLLGVWEGVKEWRIARAHRTVRRLVAKAVLYAQSFRLVELLLLGIFVSLVVLFPEVDRTYIAPWLLLTTIGLLGVEALVDRWFARRIIHRLAHQLLDIDDSV